MTIEKNNFITSMKIQTLYNIPQTEFLSYHKLITCIPSRWKTMLKNEEIQYRVPEYIFEKLVPQLKTCRFIYNMLLKVKTNIQTHQEKKWEYKVSSELDWKNIFSQIIKKNYRHKTTQLPV